MIEVVGTVIAVIAVMFVHCLMLVAVGVVIWNLFYGEQEEELEAEPDTE